MSSELVTLAILRVVTELPHVELLELTLLKPRNHVAKKQQGEQKMGMVCRYVHILQSLRDVITWTLFYPELKLQCSKPPDMQALNGKQSHVPSFSLFLSFPNCGLERTVHLKVPLLDILFLFLLLLFCFFKIETGFLFVSEVTALKVMGRG